MRHVLPMNRGCFTAVALIVLLASTCTGAIRVAASRESIARLLRQRFPACSSTDSSAVAVSIVFALCSGSIVLAAEAVATASVNGCGDTLAAGIGVALAQLDVSNVESIIYMAFSTALTASQSTDGGTAIAEAMTLAIASAAPSIISPQDMLGGVASAIVQVATTGECKAAASLATTVLQTLSSAAPDLVTSFKSSLQSAAAVSTPPLSTSCLATALIVTDSARFKDISGGRGCGYVRRPIFSKDVDHKRTTSSVAINIAMTACPTSDTASVTAMAVAIASTSDMGLTADAIAAVAGTNVDLVSLVQQVFLQSASTKSHSGIQAMGTAITMLTADDQARLITAVGAALKSVVGAFGCDGLQGMLPTLSAAGVGPAVIIQLCSCVSVCPGTC